MSNTVNLDTTNLDITNLGATNLDTTSTLIDNNRDNVTTAKNGLQLAEPHLENNMLELLAEKAQVNIERIQAGQVKLSKIIKSETVNVPVTLTQEILVIEHTSLPKQIVQEQLVQVITAPNDATPTIMVDGSAVTLGDQPIEIVLSQQVAKIAIETQVTEQVKVTTSSQTHEQAIAVTLRHEELVTEEVTLDNPTVISTTTVENPEILPRSLKD